MSKSSDLAEARRSRSHLLPYNQRTRNTCRQLFAAFDQVLRLVVFFLTRHGRPLPYGRGSVNSLKTMAADSEPRTLVSGFFIFAPRSS